MNFELVGSMANVEVIMPALTSESDDVSVGYSPWTVAKQKQGFGRC
jgi:hypothetical protein